jgi:hypothetical protein
MATPEVLEFIGGKIATNIRELEGASSGSPRSRR